MADAMKLLPCPFCGDDDPEITGENGWVWIACTTGSDCAGRGPDSDDEASAIEAWNRRASPPAREEAPAEGALIGQIEALLAIQNPSHPLPGLARQLLNRAVTALRNRTSEPEAGAVAWRVRTSCGEGGFLTDSYPHNGQQLVKTGYSVQPLYTHPAPATADKLRGIIDAATDAALPPVCDVTGNGTKERASIQVEIANRIIAALNEGGE